MVVGEVETIQRLYWYFETELGLRLQNTIVVVDSAAVGASEVVHLSNLVFIASSRHEEQLGAVCCTFCIAFDCGSHDLSGRDADIQSRDVVSCRTLFDHSMVGIGSFCSCLGHVVECSRSRKLLVLFDQIFVEQ